VDNAAARLLSLGEGSQLESIPSSRMLSSALHRSVWQSKRSCNTYGYSMLVARDYAQEATVNRQRGVARVIDKAQRPQLVHEMTDPRLVPGYLRKWHNAVAVFLSLSEGSPFESTPSKRDASLRDTPLSMAGFLRHRPLPGVSESIPRFPQPRLSRRNRQPRYPPQHAGKQPPREMALCQEQPVMLYLLFPAPIAILGFSQMMERTAC